jgi:tRNA U34 5-methylaminomethyl-2-thiouridine-forming methyltransferase MnmC
MTAPLQLTLLGTSEVYLITTRDGSETLYSQKFDSTYHSIYGAVSESRHVFIQHGLATQSGKLNLRILELGFGTGLNAFLAFLFSIKNKVPITYFGLEAYPISSDIARKLDYPGYLAAKENENTFLRMHREDSFITDDFTFKRTSAWEGLREESGFDCIFFDAFAPIAQPELWVQDVFDIMYKMTNHGGCLITYCAQGEVRRRMQKAGYDVERIPGATGKREMLRATKNPQRE